MYALSLGIKKVMTKVSRTGLLKILGDSDLQAIVTPKRLITNKILRYVRSLGQAERFKHQRQFIDRLHYA